MRVRMPQFDFSDSTPHWLPRAPEFAQSLNAVSIVIPYLERFLNRVMARARKEIVGSDPLREKVRSDISLFIKQESCHYTIHDSFNQMMREAGYPKLPDIEKRIAAHYEQLFATKSIRFLVGYCEGFESLLPPTAEKWFDGTMDKIMADAQACPANMWRWHIMEEFEHRTVCHDTFEALGGSYPLRVYSFLYQISALSRMKKWVMSHLMEVDRASMSPAEVEASIQRERTWSKDYNRNMIRALPRTLSPGYSPHKIPEPKNYLAAQREIEDRWVPALTRNR